VNGSHKHNKYLTLQVFEYMDVVLTGIYNFKVRHPLQCIKPDDGQLRAGTCCCYSLSTYAI